MFSVSDSPKRKKIRTNQLNEQKYCNFHFYQRAQMILLCQINNFQTSQFILLLESQCAGAPVNGAPHDDCVSSNPIEFFPIFSPKMSRFDRIICRTLKNNIYLNSNTKFNQVYIALTVNDDRFVMITYCRPL
jgi:hypothetical protein